jgi:GH15 family glucan-1,4-alpha-glucosidase
VTGTSSAVSGTTGPGGNRTRRLPSALGDRKAFVREGYLPIDDYAAIGDGRTVALVSRQGSIDWLCLPHISGPPLFTALLDKHRGGRFAIRPTSPFRAERRYVRDTNIIETRFETRSGCVSLTDCMTLLPAERYHDELRPQAEILRLMRGCEGSVELEVVCEPRPDFGRSMGRFEDRGRLGWAFCSGDQVSFLRGEIPLERSGDNTVVGRFTISSEETRCISFAYTRRDIAVVPTLGSAAVDRLEETRRWWETWSGRCLVEGRHRNPIVRSALVLKLLNYDLSGAVVAAATTSLPEVVGGIRNWDYRYCWLRDAALTFQAFVDIGYTREARRFIDWLLHATRLTWPRLDVLYDVFGEAHLPEYELEQLEGYKGSRPVRIGNAAHAQLQLDVYGSVIQTAYEFVSHGGELDAGERRLLVGFGRRICKLWREPDDGIWEPRGRRVHHTYSKIMCWTGLDRLLMLAEQGELRAPVERFRRERDAIENAVEQHGFNRKLNSYVASFDGETPDASLLLAARCGYRRADDPRLLATFDFIERSLSVDGMLYRYPPGTDGLAGAEGAFGIASFWAVEFLALAGRVAAARARFEALLQHATDLGLYAEEFDPRTGAALGNFPQAFTHVGLITAALALRQAEAGPRDLLSQEADRR